MPNWVSKERINIMKLYGAEVHLVSKEEGGFQEAIKRADILAKEINGFRPDQFNNKKNIEAHYHTTGYEIINQVETINSFVSGIGTGGTLIGIAKRIKEKNPNVKIVALEPKQLPIMTKKIKNGTHRIEGIGDDFIPNIVDKKLIDKVVTIDDEDAINMSRILAKKYGLGVGISSGANLIAAIITAKNQDNVVTIFADDLKKYLTTDLTKKIKKNKKLISNKIEIISIEAL
jgi:cysteine synthase A